MFCSRRFEILQDPSGSLAIFGDFLEWRGIRRDSLKDRCQFSIIFLDVFGHSADPEWDLRDSSNREVIQPDSLKILSGFFKVRCHFSNIFGWVWVFYRSWLGSFEILQNFLERKMIWGDFSKFVVSFEHFRMDFWHSTDPEWDPFQCCDPARDIRLAQWKTTNSSKLFLTSLPILCLCVTGNHIVLSFFTCLRPLNLSTLWPFDLCSSWEPAVASLTSNCSIQSN